MSKKSDAEVVLDHYYQGRAKHFLNGLLIPLIRTQVKKPKTDDVASGTEVKYVVDAVRGAEKADAAAARAGKLYWN